MAGTFSLIHPETRPLTGGDLLAQSLKQLSVEVAFGLHGGHLDAFLMGCDHVGIRLVDTRHETAAVQAAEGYSRISSKLGVCFVTANSGYSNGIPGLATASAEKSPILCITSSVPSRDNLTNALQGSIDQVVVAAPLTKLAHRVTHPEDIPRIVSHAVRTALAGPMGPVLLDFPIDMLFSPVQEKLISWGSIASPPAHPPGPSADAVDEAVSLIRSAERPVIVIGSGVRTQQAGKHLMEFSNISGIPIFYSKFVSVIPPSFELYGGAAGNLALLQPLQKKRPDLVMLLGARTGMFLGGQSGAIIPADRCKLVQVDLDASEIGRALPVDLGVVSETAQFISSLTQMISGPKFSGSIDSEWVNDILSLKSLPSPHESEPEKQASGLLHPYHALKHIFSAAEPGSIVVTDGGEAGAWAGSLAPLCKPSAILSATGYLGFLGTGFGYSLGAAVAAPDRQVISIQGDGSAGFHLMELDTYKRFNLNITTVIVNNSCWAMSRNGQDIIYGTQNPARLASSLNEDTSYEGVGHALGNAAARLDQIDDIKPTMQRLQSQSGPGCINLNVDAKPTHPFTSNVISMTDDPDVIVVPYYSNIPKPHYNVG